MKQQISQFFYAITLLALAGCSADELSTLIVAHTHTPTPVATGLDPCRNALINIESAGISDEHLANLRKFAAERDKDAYFEKLGWAYLNKARVNHDSRYAFLAGQVADCLADRRPAGNEWRLMRAYLLHQQHRFKEAEKIAMELVNTRGRWFDYAVLGDVLMEQGKMSEAIGAYQKMVDQKPGPQAYGRIGRIRWLVGDVEGAREMTALAVQSTSTRDRDSAAWWRTELARLQWQQGAIESALQLVQHALTLYPEHAAANFLAGQILLAEGDAKSAVAYLSHAADLDPIPEYLWTLAEAQIETGDLVGAERTEAWLIRSGQVADPRTLSLYLASRHLDSEKALTLAHSEKQIRQDPFTLDLLAWAYFKTGNLTTADEYMVRAMSHGTRHPRLFFHAAAIAGARGETERAGEYVALALNDAHMLMPSERRQLAALNIYQDQDPV